MHIMLDIETLGTRPGATILSIGAVPFDMSIVCDGDPFYVEIDRGSSCKHGFGADPETERWWAEQPPSTRGLFDRTKDGAGALSLPYALGMFDQWLRKHATLDGIWGNGADFDNAILAETYQRIGCKVPWSWRANRCYRTLKNLLFDGERIEAHPNNGTPHHALHDALHQARHAKQILRVIQSVKVEPDE